MDELEKLRERLRLVEALYARPGTDGERSAAHDARARLQEKLSQLEGALVEEIQYSVPDQWSRQLFLALLRRHGIRPYRYKGQRRTTVMFRASRRLVDEVFIPEFDALNQVLIEGLGKITHDLISSTIHADSSDATEERTPAPGRILPAA
jgi:hypothetical protein